MSEEKEKDLQQGNANLAIWSQVEATDPAYVKTFSRPGGFKGTAINPTYLARKATEVFGPMGIGWGIDIIDERYVEGGPIFNGDSERIATTIIHVIRATLWYIIETKKGEVTQFGQTTFVGRNGSGLFTDEEAPKKSLTDAMSKCLSLLGFSADIFTGDWDANKDANEIAAAAQAHAAAKAPSKGATSVSTEEKQASAKPLKGKQVAESPVDIEAEKAKKSIWEQRIMEADETALQNAVNFLNATFKDSKIKEEVKSLIDKRKQELGVSQ